MSENTDNLIAEAAPADYAWILANPSRASSLIARLVTALRESRETTDASESIVALIHGGHDMESHARSYNEGYEDAVAQGLQDNPLLARDWLDAKLVEVRAQALEDAANDYPPTSINDPNWAANLGIYPEEWLRERARSIRNETEQ